MGNLSTISQKLKGDAQQIKGKIEIASGEPIKGNIDKVRGKANVIAANIKMQADDSSLSSLVTN